MLPEVTANAVNVASVFSATVKLMVYVFVAVPSSAVTSTVVLPGNASAAVTSALALPVSFTVAVTVGTVDVP